MQNTKIAPFEDQRQICRECLLDATNEAADKKIGWIRHTFGGSGDQVEDFDLLYEARQETYSKFLPIVCEFPEINQNGLTTEKHTYPFSEALFRRAIERCASKIRADLSLAKGRQQSKGPQRPEAVADPQQPDQYTKILEAIADRLRPDLLSWMLSSNEKKNKSKSEKQKNLLDYTEEILDLAIRAKIDDYARIPREFPTVYAKYIEQVPRETQTPAVTVYLARSIERFVWDEIKKSQSVLPLPSDDDSAMIDKTKRRNASKKPAKWPAPPDNAPGLLRDGREQLDS